jgi:hypothetical protein
LDERLPLHCPSGIDTFNSTRTIHVESYLIEPQKWQRRLLHLPSSFRRLRHVIRLATVRKRLFLRRTWLTSSLKAMPISATSNFSL